MLYGKGNLSSDKSSLKFKGIISDYPQHFDMVDGDQTADEQGTIWTVALQQSERSVSSKFPSFVIPGDPSVDFGDENIPQSYNVFGALSMANKSASDSGGSQFFVNVRDDTFLDWWDRGMESNHRVFRRIIEGMDQVTRMPLLSKS
eukprot:COSAG06_NODE_11764_length_1468_cov_0.815924_2_plen_145_part_01